MINSNDAQKRSKQRFQTELHHGLETQSAFASTTADSVINAAGNHAFQQARSACRNQEFVPELRNHPPS